MDEYGYPASVTIAQIIQESGFGTSGPGGKKDRAFQDWLTGTATFLVLKEPVQRAVFLCVRQR